MDRDKLARKLLTPDFDIAKAEVIRRSAGMSYADIANAMGLKSRQAVGHWFRGRGEPNLKQLKKMASALHCHWLELVTEETLVVFTMEERNRIERIRRLDAAGLAKLDAFLSFEDGASKAAE
jgi:transcriptional regulator with XRE-family HTH domain